MPRLARTLQLGALALTAGAAWNAWEHDWYPTVGLAYLAFVLLVLAAGRNHHDRKVRERHEQARRAAVLDDQTLAAPPPACCQIWKYSGGEAHGADCTRPPLPRRNTARLTGAEQAAFEQIAGRGEGSAA